jgi:hypothetical protein
MCRFRMCMDIIPDEPVCDFIHLCARYGTFAKTEEELCGFCGYDYPSKARNIL